MERSSQADDAYRFVLEQLRNGEIGVGDKIVDKALALKLRMSRMPAREALLRLVNEGYLVGTTRGFALPAHSRSDILDMFEVRRLLEPRAAASAALILADEDLAALEAAYGRARAANAAGDVAGLKEANAAFRGIWLAAVPNRRLVDIVSRFFDHVLVIRSITLEDKAARDVAVEMTGPLLERFAARDSLGVHDRMEAFIDAARASFLTFCAD